MLEQSESEGNSLYTARIRLKTFPKYHFIFHMKYDEFYRIIYNQDKTQHNLPRVKQLTKFL